MSTRLARRGAIAKPQSASGLGSLSFASSTDQITWALGGANYTTALTLALVCKPTLTGADVELLGDSDGVPALYIRPTTQEIAYYAGGNEGFHTSAVVASGVWQLLAVTKAAGTVAPRLHRYRFDNANLVQVASALTVANATPGAFKLNPDSGQPLTGLVAAVGMAKTALSDGAIAALVTRAAWLASAMDEKMVLDGSSPFDGSGTATQSSITGTTHSTESPPRLVI